MRKRKPRTVAVAALLAMGVGTAWAAPLGTAFTYQGRLTQNGSPAQGTYDFRFALYDDPDFGSQVGPVITVPSWPVEDGLFTVQLDFGDVFDGTALWLLIQVRPGDSTSTYTAVWPRQSLTAAPYALYALHAPPGSVSISQGPGIVCTPNPITSDGTVAVDSAWADAAYVNEGQFGSVPSAMVVDNSLTANDLAPDSVGSSEIAASAVGESEITTGAVTQPKLLADGASDGYVLTTNGETMSWAPPASVSGPWQQGSDGIYYDLLSHDHVAIGGTDTSEAQLYVLADSSGIEFDLSAGTGSFVIQGDGSSNDVEVNVTSFFYGGLRCHDLLKTYDDVMFTNLESGGGTTLVVNSQGYVYKNSSSMRYKHNVVELAPSEDGVLDLRPVSFVWNATGEPDIGLIAEEVAQVAPELVLFDGHGCPDGVKYDRVAVCLLQVIKGQRARLAAQEDRVAALEREVRELQVKMKGLSVPR